MVKIEEKMIDKNEVAKQLMKSKVQAMFSHYSAGNLYYTVDVLDGKYQFPIETVDKKDCTVVGHTVDREDDLFKNNFRYIELSKDLGLTSFHAEMKGSELNRWIRKAIEKEEFIKVG